MAVAGAIIVNFGARRGQMILIGIATGVATWIELGVWIDLLIHHLTRRRDTKESAR